MSRGLPRRVPVRAGSLTAGVATAGVATAAGAGVLLDAVRRVRRLRRDGATITPLVHDLTLPGEAPARRVVVLGDSAAAGHGLVDVEAALPRRLARTLAGDGRATQLVSLARDGARTGDVVAEQLDAVAGAEVVVVGVGVNDALCRTPLSELREASGELLSSVARAASTARLVMLTCPDLGAAPGLPALVRPVVGWWCRRVAAVQTEVAGAHGVPIVSAGRDRLTPEVFGADGVHPGAQGQARLAIATLDALDHWSPVRGAWSR